MHACIFTYVHKYMCSYIHAWGFLFWGEETIAYIRFSVSALIHKKSLGASETAWRAKALAAQPGDLGSIGGIWCGREPERTPELVL